MNRSHEIPGVAPMEVLNDVPVFAMPERNSCVPTVLRSVLGHFEPTFAVSSEALDQALVREYEEAATVDSFNNFLLGRGYSIVSKQVWDNDEFIRDSRAYVRSFYEMDSDQPRVSVETFESYYTEETLVRLQHEAEVRLADEVPNPHDVTEVGLPDYEDIKRFIAADNLVAVVLTDGEGTGKHFALVCGYSDHNQRSELRIFIPDLTDYGVDWLSRDSFNSWWMPEEGITAIRLP